ncbi:hypothetical protein LSG31_09795 [Fodinisporobacter ferrooxydans]|uniref:Uncharacterized protein n=1 Tax=Fodinisporobacter ferrooxydans TaxID=2901836 RepID=A0ABY4CPL5_9BACL|nr:hypothetical protein LSG31_09795 [Alicyclobacillaceae bacterium MYW30-H2]
MKDTKNLDWLLYVPMSQGMEYHIKKLISSIPDNTQIYYDIRIKNGDITLYLLLNNINEPFTSCHFFSMDKFDKKSNEYFYTYMPLSIVGDFISIARENSIPYDTW